VSENENTNLAQTLKKQHGSTVYSYTVDVSNTDEVIRTAKQACKK